MPTIGHGEGLLQISLLDLLPGLNLYSSTQLVFA
jgi:hypothetical protein